MERPGVRKQDLPLEHSTTRGAGVEGGLLGEGINVIVAREITQIVKIIASPSSSLRIRATPSKTIYHVAKLGNPSQILADPSKLK